MKKLLSTKINEFISADVSILLFRVGVSALMLTHGFPKLMRILEGDFSFGDPIGIGQAPSLFLVTFAEFFCSLFVLIGLGTRFALIPLIITMLVAVFVAHANDPFSSKELGLFFLLSFSVLLMTGPGKFSVDAKLS